jgi:5-methyltetrahydrofolate--homocysteine methyltransferase
METVLSSPSRTVVIGPGGPFCVIGERINPTGRKKLQAELQRGDLSRLEVDVAQQVAGGADMLDVNVGDPLADEVGLMGRAVPLVQGLTELPLCIDSSVIEALEAGLSAYQGKALVNSVTGEDERLNAILPIVARHGAAVIGLANDDEIPMEPQRRLEVAKKIVSAAGDHGIPPEDVVIDPLAMPVGAEPRAVTLFLETLFLLREELGVNTTCGASNTSFGLPGRETLGASFLSLAASHGLTSAIMDARSVEIVEAVRASDFLLGKDEWGANWIAAFRAKQAAAAAAAAEATGVGSTEPARSAAAGLAGGGAGY